ncbi:MAG: thiamine/thiamine pyrophosphate ABC transporter permease ThiP [Pseudomonadota bacterium]
MARGALAISAVFGAAKPATFVGVAVLSVVLGLLTTALLALLIRAPGLSALTPGDWAAVRFTLLQATLSAFFSVALAVPLARALVRRRFPGRGLALTLLGAPFLLPVLVAVLGLLAVWGRAGLANNGLAALGLPRVEPYGLGGIVMAHVFFNLPLATRLLLQGWARVPAAHLRLALQLDFGPAATFRWIERPVLAAVLPGAFLLVFLLAMSSFAVVLTLGGGPSATTIELAIYEALRFDFDLGRAVQLALLQIGLGLGIALLLLSGGVAQPVGGVPAAVSQWPGDRAGLRLLDCAVLTVAALFLAAPLVLVVQRGVAGLAAGLPPGLWSALFTSLWIALAAAALTALGGLGLAQWIVRLGPHAARMAESVGLLLLAASPFVLGTGLFVALSRVADPFALALPLTAVLNALLALPFTLRLLVPPLDEVERRFGPLADSLSMRGVDRFRRVTLPVLARPLGFAMGLTAALSAGDLGIIALFAPPGVETLPLYMYRLMGAYRLDAAEGAALVLLCLALALFAVFDRVGSRVSRA